MTNSVLPPIAGDEAGILALMQQADLVFLPRINLNLAQIRSGFAIFAMLLYKILVEWIRLTRPNLLSFDRNTRSGLLLAGIFGSYAIGANGIGNVMGFSWRPRRFAI
ncbi:MULTISPECIES: hypothetical protein [unclassified Synechococcus]|uniref:hypothetical protein n=1 Tax=unclassified Synechococcus TaxID=2626047 RepID=UPI0020CE8EA6|nr:MULTISPECIES: hypothetical protein [unclassified Synechococcus]